MEQPPYAITVPAGMEKKVKPKIVNMDGSDDPFYRYKMPQVIAFVLGKGKMIKTMIANADQVAVSLKRPPSYLVHYIGYQLSAQCKYEAKKPAGENAQVSGDISGEKLSELTESFIREWITCPKCELPECDLEIKKKEVSIKLVCSGCGAVSSINKKVKQKQPKFVKFVINNPPTMSGGTKAIGDKDKKKVAEAERLGRTKRDSPKSRPEGEEGNLGSEEEEEEDHEWSMDTSKDAVEKRTASFEEVANRIEERNKMAEEKTQAQEKEEEIESLSSMIEKKLSVDKVSTLLFESSKGLSAEDTTSMLFDALSEGSIVENVKTYLTLLQKTVSGNAGAQKKLMAMIEDYASANKGDAKKSIPLVLKVFYDEDVVEEEVMIGWYDDASESNNDEADAKFARECAKVFIEWLKEAEEEESDDDE